MKQQFPPPNQQLEYIKAKYPVGTLCYFQGEFRLITSKPIAQKYDTVLEIYKASTAHWETFRKFCFLNLHVVADAYRVMV